jgi:hypothetical protein
MDNRNVALELAELHWKEIGKDEPSALLGFDFIRAFYLEILTSKYAEVFYSTGKSGRIISLCCVFRDHNRFSRSLQVRMIPIVVRNLLARKISFKVVIKSILTSVDLSRVPGTQYHLGMIVRCGASIPSSTFFLSKNVESAIEYLSNSDAKSAWASARISNVNSVKFLEAHQFEEVSRTDGTITFVRFMV